ncbi:hypothetical protein EVAR_101019_1 [Eumeta japonica]|uniref:Uncharacterized protein n=1 Tax=Eumeta variegata TaxID=151549 RepID=A0A4C2AB07_EUMVA|nr:hypothetical protein EVAR_101019_1 [Eumeta japonica]
MYVAGVSPLLAVNTIGLRGERDSNDGMELSERRNYHSTYVLLIADPAVSVTMKHRVTHNLVSAHFFRAYKHHVIPTFAPLTLHKDRDFSYFTKLKYTPRASEEIAVYKYFVLFAERWF